MLGFLMESSPSRAKSKLNANRMMAQGGAHMQTIFELYIWSLVVISSSREGGGRGRGGGRGGGVREEEREKEREKPCSRNLEPRSI